MDYIIFDLEWNQPPVESAVVTAPVYLTGEIIEIGAVKLSEAFEKVDELKLYIKPQYYTKMHRRIASLTGIYDRDLQSMGLPFPEAFEQFRRWCGESFAYMTWSMSDLPMLIDNMLLHGLDTSQLPVCYDIQRIFGREIMRKNTQYSLDTAIKILQEKGETAHDALNDARNTAKVCAHLDLEEYIDEYAAKAFAPEPVCRIYDSQSGALADEELATFRCPWCGNPVKCETWIPWGSWSFAAMGTCEEGDEFFVQLHHGKTHTGACYVKRLAYDMSEDLWELYQDRKELLGAQP